MLDEYPDMVYEACDALADVGMAYSTYATQVSVSLTSEEAQEWLEQAVEGDIEERGNAIKKLVQETDARFTTPDAVNHVQRVDIVRDAVIQVAEGRVAA